VISDSEGILSHNWIEGSIDSDLAVKYSCAPDACDYGTNMEFGMSPSFVVTLNPYN